MNPKRGGQKGRKGHGRRLKAPEEVNRVVVVRPDCCAECGALLLGEDPQPVRHQITELPPVKPEVIEYQQHTITCLACGAQNRGEWPAEMPTGTFGPRVQATVGYLAGRGGMSQREVQEVMGTVLHTEMGLGTVSALEQQVSEALEVAHDKTCRACQNILKLEQALWTFVDVEGVEPTNEEQTLWRWISWKVRSVLIVRAHQPSAHHLPDTSYRRLLAPLDGSQRAECALSLATTLAMYVPKEVRT